MFVAVLTPFDIEEVRQRDADSFRRQRRGFVSETKGLR
jgi:hypothetical protein